ncbi:MAG: DUF362 domain-containing protein [Clostridia bacterium]|nr:DUF362 domain-containing protein [Clostridia bacterium]
MNYDVSIVSCKSYAPDECRRALEAVLSPIGGLDWVRSGMRIVIKLNLVAAMQPDTAATTNPALVCALVSMLTERGASVILGDSPGGLFNAAHLNHVYDVTGLRAAEELGAQLNQDFSQAVAKNPDAVQAKRFQYTAYLDNADAIIDFCKLKTHGMMGMTNAVKNYFGVIPGTMKPEYHYMYPKTEDFADMLVDLCEYFRPRLSICDAVFGMEGNGPTQGRPRFIGALAASLDPHALDLACSQLLGFAPADIPTIVAAQKRGLVKNSVEELSVFGNLTQFAVPDFIKPPVKKSSAFLSGGDGPINHLAERIMRSVLTPFPKLTPSECIGCKKCANICPAKAITMQSGKPSIDRDKCIHCFCCQEFCPKGAMKVGRSFIARMMNR